MSRLLRIETEYPHPIADVWRVLTDSALMARWLMPNDFEPVVGREFSFTWPDKIEGWGGVVRCKVLEVDEPHRLSYSWQDSWEWTDFPEPTVVTWILEPAADPGRTKLVLEHSRFSGPGAEKLLGMLGNGWGMMMDRLLPAVLNGDDPLAQTEPLATKTVSYHPPLPDEPADHPESHQGDHS